MSRSISSRRRRKRRDTEPLVSAAAKGIATLAVIAGFVALAVNAQEGVPGRAYQRMYVSASETGSLRSNDRAVIGGVRVGRVVTIEPDGQRTRVELQLDPGVRLPKDTRVRLRANGLLGARYVQLIPGRSQRDLEDGATMRADANALTYGVTDALDTFDRETRGKLGTAVTGLGRGLAGNGEPLGASVEVASRATVPFGRILQTVTDEGAPERLVPALDSAMEGLDASRADLTAMLDPAARALRPFSDTGDALGETLDEAPSTLRTAKVGLDAGQRLLGAVDQLATSAQRTLPDAPAGLRQASALLREARSGRQGQTPLQRATALLRTARSAAPAAVRATDALDPVLPRIDGALTPLSPIARYVGRYECDIVNTGIVLRSMTGFVGQGTGPNGPSSQFRLQVAAGLEALGIKEGVQKRDAYYEPCTYLGRHYDVTPLTGLKGSR